jgi:pyruvate,water dikinase
MDLGEKVQAQFDYPQDVEWAIADGKLFLLQSRPITSLYPKPDIAPEPTQALISFGAIQGMLDPLTPMGQDAIRLLFAGGASLFDYEHTLETQKVLHMAGERLWANLTPVIKNKIGQRLLLKSIGGTEPGSRVFFAQLIEDPLFQSDSGWPKFRTVRRFFKFGRKTALGVIRNMVHPERARKAAIRETDRFLHSFASRARAIGGEPDEILSQRTALFLSLWDSFPVVIPTLAYAALAGLLPFTILRRIGSHAGVQRDRFLELFRGLPNNPTTEMDLAMWQTACVVRDIPEERESFVNESTEVLTTRYLEQRLHPAAQTAISNFLETYGMRGLAEIDFGRPRWNENPKQVIQTLQSYIAIPKNNAPDIVFNQGRRDAENAFEEILEKTRSSRGGFIKTRVLKWAYKRFRALSGLRESPKFFVVRFMGIVRIALLASGTDLVMSKHLQQREDIFFLRFSELSDLSRNKLNPNDLQEIVRSRKTRYQLEMRRKQIPRILMSNGEVFYEKITGFTDDTNLITGSPVSPGTVEGLARVVHDPAQTDLLPGEIIVCRGTDPAWTPLFLTAGGLVMEVGGMMTHGSVVAREYGIPAVVGVHGATETLKTGMKIRVDGSAGTITPID